MSLAGMSVETLAHDAAPKHSVRFNEKTVDEIFSVVDQCRLPGAAAGIAIRGTPVYRKGFGLASMELPQVLSPSTRMRIGSSTKHFTALTWMLLCEDGIARLDDPIGKYLPELHPVAQRVTARQLITHVSGLRDAFDISWHFNGTGKRVTSEDLLSLYTTIDDINEAPGRAWIYNNGGYVVLSAAIERITGQPLDVVMRDRIFTPVGMNDTLLRRWDSDFVPNSATLHTLNECGQFERSYLGTAGAGQGGISSTVDDMLRWLAHMDNPRVGSIATWTTMRTPQSLENGMSTGYGLGLRRHKHRGVDIISHSGGVMGGNCQMLKAPALGLDIVILVNRSDIFGISLAENILDACLVGIDPPAQPAAAPLHAGTFQSSRTGRVVQLFSHANQQMASIDGFDLPVKADDDGLLRPTGIYPQRGQGILIRDELAEPRCVELHAYGSVDELVRIAEDRGASRVPTGRYVSATTGIQVEIVETENSAQMRTAGPSGSATYDLVSLGPGVWRARLPNAAFPPGGILVFDSNDAAFSFWSFRTRALRFRKLD